MRIIKKIVMKIVTKVQFEKETCILLVTVFVMYRVFESVKDNAALE